MTLLPLRWTSLATSLVIAALAAPVSAADAAELVGNGSFETPVVNGDFAVRPAGTTLGAWTVGGGGVDQLGGDTWQAAAGRQSVDLNESSPGSVFQELATVPGASYALRFAMAGNSGEFCTQPITTRMSVRWGEAEVAQPTFDTSGHSRLSMGWTAHALTVAATGTPTRIEFVSLAPASFCGPTLDAVSVVGPEALSPPVLGKQVNVEPVKGRVFVSLPERGAGAAASPPGLKGRTFVPLSEARQIPTGSLVDTRRGTVGLTSARNAKGGTQSGAFLGGVFQVVQSRKRVKKALTELRLKGSSFKGCTGGKRGERATAARLSTRTIRKLRARAKGRFRTRGRHSAATARGTVWTVADRCDGTLTTVRRGKVVVRDFRRRKNVAVRAGQRYLAKATG